MATLSVHLDVDETELIRIVNRKYKVKVDMDVADPRRMLAGGGRLGGGGSGYGGGGGTGGFAYPGGEPLRAIETTTLALGTTYKSLATRIKERYIKLADVVVGSVANIIDAISKTTVSTVKGIYNQLKRETVNIRPQISGAVKKVGVGATATVLGSVAFSARKYQLGIEQSKGINEAFQKLLGNIDSSLYGYIDSIKTIVFDVSRKTGVKAEEIIDALSQSLQLVDITNANAVRQFAETFAKMQMMEGVSPDTYQVIANWSKFTNYPVDYLSGMIDEFTNRLGQQDSDVYREIKRLADQFKIAPETMFATLEYYFYNFSMAPREVIAELSTALDDLSQYFQGKKKFKQLGEEARRLMQAIDTEWIQYLAQHYQQAGMKFNQTYDAFIKTKEVAYNQFFNKQREQIKLDMYNFVMERQPALENAYNKIRNFTTTFFGDLEPIARSIFISPETGMPTFMTALIPIIEKVSAIHDILKLIHIAIDPKQGKTYGLGEFYTNKEYWLHWFDTLMKKLTQHANVDEYTKMQIARHGYVTHYNIVM
ncbi:MAG: hypothetical protein QXS54_09080 [Candidatus Methanomethylicaceae archaeon]